MDDDFFDALFLPPSNSPKWGEAKTEDARLSHRDFFGLCFNLSGAINHLVYRAISFYLGVWGALFGIFNSNVFCAP